MAMSAPSSRRAIGPFQASVDQIGTAISFAPIRNGLQQNDSLGDLVKFLPPKGT